MATKAANSTGVKKVAATGTVKMTRGKLEEYDHLIYSYLQKQPGFQDIDWFRLQQASCPAKVNGMPAKLVLFFNSDTAKEKGVTINDYMDLKEHPELILLEGYLVAGKGGEVLIKKWEGMGVSILEEKIKKGIIADVGIVTENTSSHKWLGGFGRFLMAGGFIVVLLVIVGLIVVISILARGH